MPFRFLTAGESHGKALVAIVEGMPAGVAITAEAVNSQLSRRMQGYGRGARMKIEQDEIEWLAGVRAGETLGSPIAMLIRNRDWEHWQDVMAAEGEPGELRRRRVVRPRPGHADLVGVLKYDRLDARDILERASARETAARVACGAVARRLLEEFGIDIGSHLVSLGGIVANRPDAWPARLNQASDSSAVRTLDRDAETRMIALIDQCKSEGDTLGGEIEVIAQGLPVGLGSHVSWDRKLDGRLAGMLMSIPAVKGVEIGMGFEAARRKGSQVHDAILSRESVGTGGADVIPSGARDRSPADRSLASLGMTDSDSRHATHDFAGGFARASNNAGGLEGGMTTGEPLVIRVAMKPISTLMAPLRTINLSTGEAANAQSERSDVTAVPAMGVIAEALVALVLADAMLEKFGGDSLGEMRRNFTGYLAAAGTRWKEERDHPPQDTSG